MALKVMIVMGSDSDFDQTAPAWKVLESLGVPFEVMVASAHRSPERVVTMARSARHDGFGVILAAAILASTDAALAARLEAFREEQAKNVGDADARVKAKLSASGSP